MGRVLDFLFPLECIACGAAGAHACAACLAAVALSPKAAAGPVRTAAAFAYAQPLVRRLLHDAKFEGWTCAVGPLETLTRRAAAKFGATFPADAAVMEVPLHPSRLRMRGFNQAAALARAFAGATGRSRAKGFLQRTRRTRPQTEAGDRSKNVRGAFICPPMPAGLRGRPIVLVDDVVTSGATMRACADVLRAAGAGPVSGFALAWGSGKEKDEAEASSSPLT